MWAFHLAVVVVSYPDDVKVKKIFKDKQIFIIIVGICTFDV